MSRGIDQTTRRARVSLKPDAGQVIAYWDGGYLATPLSMNGAVVIGRDSTADVRVPHPSVSRSHVRLSFGPKPAIEDLGSVNGTRLAGRSLTAHTRTPIPCGAVIEMRHNGLVIVNASGIARASRTSRAFMYLSLIHISEPTRPY